MADFALPPNALRVSVNKEPAAQGFQPQTPQPPFQSQESFVERQVEFAIKLGQNPKTTEPAKFTNGTNTITLSGHRSRTRIKMAGAPAGSSASIEIYGLPLSTINQISTLGMVYNFVPLSTIVVSAGTAQTGLTQVFAGTILAAYGEFSGAPDAPFMIEAQSGLAEGIAPVPASSFRGNMDVATFMSGIARQMNLGFENSGITAKLNNGYYSGDLTTQMEAAARDAGIRAEIVDGGTILAIYPIGGTRNPKAVLPLISKATGMDGYPSYTRDGILVKTVFDPRIAFGGLFKLQSSLKLVTDVWGVNSLDLALDCQVTNGDWLSIINGFNPAYARPVVGVTK
jgi:hypothetical protein